MSVIPFRRGRAAPALAPMEPYYEAEPQPLPIRRLRSLTEIEQMYAYWGSDLWPEKP
jgi:hypothetical protein